MRDFVASARAVLGARWYLRRATSVASTVRMTGRPVLFNAGTMVIADRARLVSTVAKLELATGPGGRIEIGERAFINYGTSLGASLAVTTGANCLIGTHCLIIDDDFHRLEPERRSERPEPKPIVIEDNVWLGARVIVLPGVTIGEGSAIGAGSVVTRDIPPRSLAVGVPAKVIRDL